MHPSLSKSERKRYAGFDPDDWYPWTQEIAAEFTDLMRRSPRDTSFARSFAYAAEKAVADGEYVPADDLVANLARLPAAYEGPEGSGFEVESTAEGRAALTYRGMPGFTNVCIAVTGELEQRLKDAGARGVEVRHGRQCRLHGGDICEFEVSWSGSAAPPGARAADVSKMAGAALPKSAAAARPAPAPKPEPRAAKPAAPAAPAAAAPRPPRERAARPADVARPTAADADASSQDLFTQLKGRLEEAERQAALHAELEAEIEGLQAELDDVRADADRRVAAATSETERVRQEFDDLKRKIRDLVG